MHSFNWYEVEELLHPEFPNYADSAGIADSAGSRIFLVFSGEYP